MATDGRHFRPTSTFYALCEKNESNECLNTASVKPKPVHVKRKNCRILNELLYCVRNVELPVGR